jgi:hypothetical protein
MGLLDKLLFNKTKLWDQFLPRNKFLTWQIHLILHLSQTTRFSLLPDKLFILVETILSKNNSISQVNYPLFRPIKFNNNFLSTAMLSEKATNLLLNNKLFSHNKFKFKKKSLKSKNPSITKNRSMSKTEKKSNLLNSESNNLKKSIKTIILKSPL